MDSENGVDSMRDCWGARTTARKMSEEDIARLRERAKETGLYMPPSDTAKVSILDEGYSVIDYISLME